MSKRMQERKMESEPAVAKPRSVCLISTSLNTGQPSSFGPDVSNIPGNPQLYSGSEKGAVGNCERDTVQKRVQNPETCSRLWKGDNQSQRSCGKLQRDYVQGNMLKSSVSCVKLQRKIGIQLQTTWLDHHNLQGTVHGYVEKSLHESSSKVESNGGWWDVWLEDQRIDLGTIYVDNDKTSNSFWLGLC